MPVIALPAGELGLVVAAGFLLLVAAALWLIAQLLTHSLGKAPVIGGWVASHLIAWLYDAQRAILSAAKATWHGAERLFTWAEQWITAVWDHVALLAADIAGTIANIVTVQIPASVTRAEAAAITYATSAAHKVDVALHAGVAAVASSVTRARQELLAGIRQSELTAARETDALRAGTDAALAALSAATGGAIARAEALAAAGIDQVRGEAGQLAGQALATAESDIAAARQYLAGQILAGDTALTVALKGVRTGIYTDLSSWADTAVTAGWPGAAGDIEALRRAAGQDFPWLSDLAGALGGLGAAGLLGTLIRSMATSQALTRLATDCVVPGCRDLGSFPSDLSSLLGTVTSAAMLAWIVFLVTDPSGWATETETAAYGTVTGLIDGIRHLIGV